MAGEVLDVLVQTKGNKAAALKLMRKLLKKYGLPPENLVTDDLRSLCVTKTKSGRNGDEGRRRQRVILCLQRAERRERSAHLCLTTDAFSFRCNNERSIAESDADAARQKR